MYDYYLELTKPLSGLHFVDDPEDYFREEYGLIFLIMDDKVLELISTAKPWHTKIHMLSKPIQGTSLKIRSHKKLTEITPIWSEII